MDEGQTSSPLRERKQMNLLRQICPLPNPIAASSHPFGTIVTRLTLSWVSDDGSGRMAGYPSGEKEAGFPPRNEHLQKAI